MSVTSSLLPLCSENTVHIISVLFNLLRWFYGPGGGLSWGMFQSCLKKFFKFGVEWNILFNWILLIGGIFQIFCILAGSLLVLSVVDREVLKSITTMDLSVLPFSSISFFMYFEALLFGMYTFRVFVLLVDQSFCHCVMFLFVCSNFLCSIIYFIRPWYSHSLFLTVCMLYLFLFFYFQPIYVQFEVSFL